MGLAKTLLGPTFNYFARRYKANVEKELRKFGLRYEDLLDPMGDPDLEEALSRLPQHELDLRNQRLKRAMDLSMKHTHLSKEMQAKQTPFLPYVQDQLQQVRAERKEREALGSDVPYTRAI
ncbi:hypothetical protein SELMODRAFT_228505 [Selaginella moellendorffii]|uniref:Complex III subunit VII n=1 Tax=Selaginella moellendorffii TaxID=88036 RepID=D8S3K6_SELML|nr:cytochrome b-c1 complex subunit 7-2 [Selaginella moellendorffii]EFJ21121.1 hypothetical protein SELMODRAFT_228505 [Selaginella moellendorffii]|eukprot:XP_002977783.1 cytochrome b-c1 complex subunit 7-2 [Selaginella moellendorffii]